VILCGFAAIVGVLTTRQIHEDFNARSPARRRARARASCARTRRSRPVLRPSAHDRPRRLRRRPERRDPRRHPTATRRHARRARLRARRAHRSRIDGWRVESAPVRIRAAPLVVQYARRLSDVQATANRVKLFLAFGVLGGARSPCSPAWPPPGARWSRSPS
jgi:hypothetical protein